MRGTRKGHIKQVQILVNGATPHLSNVDVDLASAISRNEDIINVISDEEEEVYIEEDDYISDEDEPVQEENIEE